MDGSRYCHAPGSPTDRRADYETYDLNYTPDLGKTLPQAELQDILKTIVSTKTLTLPQSSDAVYKLQRLPGRPS